MASVVSGIESVSDNALWVLVATAGAFVGAATCGAAAVADFRLMNAANETTRSAKQTTLHRVCMKYLAYRDCGLESYRRRSNAVTHPEVG
jgi:hypothetical protein